MSNRQVYIGNGETINVKDNEEVRYFLDLDKLFELIIKHKKITVGASGDWFFTAYTLTEIDIEEIKNYSKYILRSSGWSRFEARWEDSSEDITLEIPLKFVEYSFKEGFYDGIHKIQQWFPGIYHDCLKNLNYETIKKLQEEIKPIIEKYKLLSIKERKE